MEFKRATFLTEQPNPRSGSKASRQSGKRTPQEEFARDVAGLANGTGGLIVIGVDEKTWAIADLQSTRDQYTDVMRAWTRPYLALDAFPLEADGQEVHVLSVPPSATAPHSVGAFSNTGAPVVYPIRSDAGKRTMEEHEIANAYRRRFTSVDSVADRLGLAATGPASSAVPNNERKIRITVSFAFNGMVRARLDSSLLEDVKQLTVAAWESLTHLAPTHAGWAGHLPSPRVRAQPAQGGVLASADDELLHSVATHFELDGAATISLCHYGRSETSGGHLANDAELLLSLVVALELCRDLAALTSATGAAAVRVQHGWQSLFRVEPTGFQQRRTKEPLRGSATSLFDVSALWSPELTAGLASQLTAEWIAEGGLILPEWIDTDGMIHAQHLSRLEQRSSIREHWTARAYPIAES